MAFQRIIRELRETQDGSKSKSRRQVDRKFVHGCGRSHIASESSTRPYVLVQGSRWANLPSELLLDVIRRVNDSQTLWPARRDVIACAAICRSWRQITKEIVRTPEQCGLLTFPVSLKQPGPTDSPIQCFIKRDRATSTYRLYLGLSPALSGDASKLLLAARKIRRATKTDFLLSLASDDFSRYIGKLRSNFLGTKFTVHDSKPLCDHAIQSNGQSQRKIYSKQQLSCKAPIGNLADTISYELNILRTRGPRRMKCTMHSIPISAIQEGGTTPNPSTFGRYIDEQFSPLSVSEVKFGSGSPIDLLQVANDTRDPLILKNKSPRWHEQLQCWCLNFKGRVTVASVKNFQLVAAVEPYQNVPAAEQEKVILQFGKIGKDIFTMDYRYPLSAFQAFSICLSSFDTKPACE